MRPKKRYILAYHTSGNVLNEIKARYAEKFGSADLEKASLQVTSDSNGFVTLRCNLSCYKHLLETLASMNSSFVILNVSGTLKALRSREDTIKKRFMSGIDINT